MASDESFEVLSDASNAVIARHPGRSHPGVLVQGDSLRALLDDVDELVEEADGGDLGAVKEVSLIIQARLRDLLSHYEAVLEQEGWELPYSGRVSG
jgi:hypothetical protein